MTDGEAGRDAAKRAAAEAAVEAVSDGDVVGLGTGSTAAYAIEAIGREVDAGLDVVGVPTSHGSRTRAVEAGIPLAGLDEVDVDVAIDGADQVASAGSDQVASGGSDQVAVDASDRREPGGGGRFDLVKGGGAAHAREKVVDASADWFVVVIDPSKEVDLLDHPVPVEVLPMARTTVADALRELGAEPTLRTATRKSGPVVTDNGNLVLDADVGAVDDPAGLADDIAAIPGVVEHGLFVGLADEVVVGRADGTVERRMP